MRAGTTYGLQVFHQSTRHLWHLQADDSGLTERLDVVRKWRKWSKKEKKKNGTEVKQQDEEYQCCWCRDLHSSASEDKMEEGAPGKLVDVLKR